VNSGWGVRDDPCSQREIAANVKGKDSHGMLREWQHEDCTWYRYRELHWSFSQSTTFSIR